MAELVNLRQFRKRKERGNKDVVAAANRVAFGETKTQKRLDKAKRELAQKRLDDHKRDD